MMVEFVIVRRELLELAVQQLEDAGAWEVPGQLSAVIAAAISAEQRASRIAARLKTRKLLDINVAEFKVAYSEAMDAVEGAGVSFIDLAGKRVTVMNGRRTVVG